MAAAGASVVFVHGMFLHATSWDAWVELFRAAGYAPVAPGWPGEAATVAEAREQPGRVAGKGIDAVVAHYAQIIGSLDAGPIIIGHSTGGLVVQRLLGQDLASAAVAIQAPPIKGVVTLAPSPARVAWVALRNPANRSRALSLTPRQFRYAFGNAVSPAESDDLYQRWSIPSPGKPIFELASASLSRQSPAKVNTANSTRGPLLLIAGGKDHGVPAAVAKATVKLYRSSPAVTDYQEYPDRGHSLPIDSGWREVAEATLAWLKQHSR